MKQTLGIENNDKVEFILRSQKHRRARERKIAVAVLVVVTIATILIGQLVHAATIAKRYHAHDIPKYTLCDKEFEARSSEAMKVLLQRECEAFYFNLEEK